MSGAYYHQYKKHWYAVTRKILRVRREGRAMKHEGSRSTNRCIKG
jgi:hypothetical protein